MKRCALCGTTSDDVAPGIAVRRSADGELSYTKVDRCRDHISCRARSAAARQPAERP
jgi:hypothetical protein